MDEFVRRARGRGARGRASRSTRARLMGTDRLAASARGPRWRRAITRIRDAGLRTAALTNNWPRPTTAPLDAERATRLGLFDVIVESAVEGLRKPDPRIYEHRRSPRSNVLASEAVFLDDLGMNLKPARAMGMTTIKVVDPDDALAELDAPCSDFAGAADGPAVGTPRRTGTDRARARGVPRRSRAHRARPRAGRSGSPTGSRPSRSTSCCRARSAARSRPPTPIAARARPRGRDRRRARSSTTRNPTTTSRWRSCAATKDDRWLAMVEGRWEEFGAEPPDVFRARVAPTVDEIVAALSPGERVVAVCHGGVINVALAIVLGLDRHLWFEPHYTSLSPHDRVAHAASARSRQLNERAHLEAQDGRLAHDTSTSNTTDRVTDRHDRPARRAQRGRPRRPRPSSPTRSARSTPTTTHDRRGPHRRGRHVLRGRRPEGDRRRTRATPCTDDGDGPMGPTRMLLVEAGDRRGRGLRGRRRPRARAVVRPARRGARRGVRRVLPAVGRAARRRRHRPPARA